METMLIIGIIAVVALLLLRPVPQMQVLYVPLAVEEGRGGLGCLPLIVVGVLALLVIAALGRLDGDRGLLALVAVLGQQRRSGGLLLDRQRVERGPGGIQLAPGFASRRQCHRRGRRGGYQWRCGHRV
jgi:hypothetical protein